MKVLVTGGAGYIGSITVTKLINEGFEVNVLDDLSTGHKENINPKANFFEGSILDPSAIDKAISGCDAIIHLAAKSIVSESVKKPEEYLTTNLQGTANILNKCKDQKIRYFIFSSTASVYGETSQNLIDEESKIRPNNPYGYSKFEAEKLIDLEFKNTEISSYIFRFFNVSGAYKNNNFRDLIENHDPETHLIPKLWALKPNQAFEIFGKNYETADGTCIRDYLHVLDVVEAFILVLNSKKASKNHIINLGTGTGSSVLEVIKEYEAISGNKIEIKFREKREGDPKQLVTSNKLAFEILGWKPLRNLRVIMEDCSNTQS